ncbi:hypothetical protein [Saccharopolyspora sp. CA-218241]|uniref:hypothetical protein n=1 Tax=Saccharopolyspora sp. CA-218241 TaxID=3240027 RepID=UPI003D97558C
MSFAALAQSLFFHFGKHAPEERRSGCVGAANSFLLAGRSAGPLLAVVLPTHASNALLGAACAVAGPCCVLALRGENAHRAHDRAEVLTG